MFCNYMLYIIFHLEKTLLANVIVSYGILPFSFVLFPLPLFKNVLSSPHQEKRTLTIYETIAVQSSTVKHQTVNRYAFSMLIISRTNKILIIIYAVFILRNMLCKLHNHTGTEISIFHGNGM